MGIILSIPDGGNSTVISDFNIVVEPGKPVFVEDTILEDKNVIFALQKGWLLSKPCDTFPGEPVINCFSSKEKRAEGIEQEKERQKRLKKDKEIEDKLYQHALKCGAKIGDTVSFRDDVQVQCKLGYGFALFDCDLFDCDLPSLNDPEKFCIDLVYDIIYSQDFVHFCEANKIYVTKWKTEDAEQIWLVSTDNYLETASHDILEQNMFDISSSKVKIAYKKLCQIMKDKHNIDMPEYEPEWMLHLYYD